jgi:hypothetical protein
MNNIDVWIRTLSEILVFWLCACGTPGYKAEPRKNAENSADFHILKDLISMLNMEVHWSLAKSPVSAPSQISCLWILKSTTFGPKCGNFVPSGKIPK